MDERETEQHQVLNAAHYLTQVMINWANWELVMCSTGVVSSAITAGTMQSVPVETVCPTGPPFTIH